MGWQAPWPLGGLKKFLKTSSNINRQHSRQSDQECDYCCLPQHLALGGQMLPVIPVLRWCVCSTPLCILFCFQAIKCCLADLPQSISMWTPDAVLWLRDSVLNCSDCSIKVSYLTVLGYLGRARAQGLHLTVVNGHLHTRHFFLQRDESYM